MSEAWDARHSKKQLPVIWWVGGLTLEEAMKEFLGARRMCHSVHHFNHKSFCAHSQLQVTVIPCRHFAHKIAFAAMNSRSFESINVTAWFSNVQPMCAPGVLRSVRLPP